MSSIARLEPWRSGSWVCSNRSATRPKISTTISITLWFCSDSTPSNIFSPSQCFSSKIEKLLLLEQICKVQCTVPFPPPSPAPQPSHSCLPCFQSHLSHTECHLLHEDFLLTPLLEINPFFPILLRLKGFFTLIQGFHNLIPVC